MASARGSRFFYPIAVCLLLSIYLLRGVVWMCVAPPFEMWDEYQHVGYLAFLDIKGHAPVLERADMPRPVMAAAIAVPMSPAAYIQFSGSGARTYPDYWANIPAFTSPGDYRPRLYEAQQAPFYYRLMLPLYRASGGMSEPAKTVAALRGANVCFSAIGLGVILIWLGRVTHNTAHAVIVGMWMCFQPLYLLNADRVANDSLAVMIGCLAMVLIMCLRPRFLLWQALALGLLIGAGGLVKTTDLALGLPAGVMLLWLACHRAISVRRCTEALVLLAFGAFAVTAHYFWFNYHQYGLLVPIQEAIANKNAHRTFRDFMKYSDPRLWIGMIRGWYLDYGLWCGGWSFTQPSDVFVDLYEILILICLGGLLMAWGFKRIRRIGSSLFSEPHIISIAIVTVFAVTLGMVYHAVESMTAWGQCTTMAWYADIGMPWLMLLLARGALAWRHSRLGYTLALSGPVMFLASEAHSTTFLAIQVYAGRSLSMKAIARLATFQPHFLGTPTLLASAAAVAVLFALLLALVGRSLARGPKFNLREARVR